MPRTFPGREPNQISPQVRADFKRAASAEGLRLWKALEQAMILWLMIPHDERDQMIKAYYAMREVESGGKKAR